MIAASAEVLTAQFRCPDTALPLRGAATGVRPKPLRMYEVRTTARAIVVPILARPDLGTRARVSLTLPAALVA
jgi:hypothetical protein